MFTFLAVILFISTVVAFVQPEKYFKGKSEQEIKRTKKWLIILTLLFFILSRLSSDGKKTSQNQQETDNSSETSPTKEPEADTYDLQADIKFSDTAYQITNKDEWEWTDCKLEMNAGVIKGGYVYKIQLVPPNSPFFVPFSEFVKSDGTRFNSYETKPLNISVSCKVNGKRGFGYYGTE